MSAYRRALIVGGARSGKSAFAERLARECGEPVLYVATATASDEEMAERIAHHRARRPVGWRTLEVQLDIIETVTAALGDSRTVLVEDLTLWLSNLLLQNGDRELAVVAGRAEATLARELESLLELPAHIILVTNEVGMGLVPEYPLGRVFRDALGRVNQAAAALVNEVYITVVGLPLRLK